MAPIDQNKIGHDEQPGDRECGKGLGVGREVNRTELRTRRAFIAAVLTIYAVSFFLPAFNTYPGWTALLLNIILFWVPAWVANPLLLLGLHSLSSGQYGKTAVLGSVALALGTIWFWSKLFSQDRTMLLGPGYWAWLGSMVLLIIGACVANEVGNANTCKTIQHSPDGFTNDQ